MVVVVVVVIGLFKILEKQMIISFPVSSLSPPTSAQFTRVWNRLMGVGGNKHNHEDTGEEWWKPAVRTEGGWHVQVKRGQNAQGLVSTWTRWGEGVDYTLGLELLNSYKLLVNAEPWPSLPPWSCPHNNFPSSLSFSPLVLIQHLRTRLCITWYEYNSRYSLCPPPPHRRWRR